MLLKQIGSHGLDHWIKVAEKLAGEHNAPFVVIKSVWKMNGKQVWSYNVVRADSPAAKRNEVVS
jgi:hypothetical protein